MSQADSHADTVADRLAHVTALGLDGEAVELGSLWADQPAVLLFVRHYG